MKNMSLNERLNVNLEETAADENQNQSAVPGNQPVRVIFEEHSVADGHNEHSVYLVKVTVQTG